MLRKLLLVGTVVPGLVVAGASAEAADLESYPAYAAVPAVPALTWSGFYVGGHLGAAINKYDVSTTFVPGPGAVLNGTPFDTINATNFNHTQTNRPTSFMGGGQIGYNLQFGQFVLGVEGDYSGMHNRDTLSRTNAITAGGRAVATLATNLDIKSEWQASVRARAGVAWGSWLLYTTGGAAFADVSLQSGTAITVTTGTGATTPVGTGVDASNGKTLSGYTIGVGGEYAFTDYVSFGVEYRFSDFGRTTFTTAGADLRPTVPNAVFSSTTSADVTSQQITGRLNIRFGNLFGPR